MCVSIAGLLVIRKNRKYPDGPQWWTVKITVLYPYHEILLSSKKDQTINTHNTTWKTLQRTMLSDKSKSQKGTYCIDSTGLLS